MKMSVKKIKFWFKKQIISKDVYIQKFYSLYQQLETSCEMSWSK